MNIPQEFRGIALRMHQDIPLVVSMEDEHELIEYLVRGVTAEQADIAGAFVDELLFSTLSKRELVMVWAKAGADWHISEDGIIPFLTLLRDRLRKR